MLTVTVEADSFDLVSIDAARVAVGGTVSVLQDLVTRASDVIARHCGRVFRLETVSEQFRLDRMQQDLVLTRYPVIADPLSPVSIVEGTNTLIEGTDFEIDYTKGTVTRLHNDRICHWSRCKTIVVYSAGYDQLADVPPALQRACLELVAIYYNSSDRDPLLRSEIVTGLGEKSYFQAPEIDLLSPEVRGLLNQFKRFRVGR
jgi:hypothetical protein